MARISFEVKTYNYGLNRELAMAIGGQGVVHTASILCRGDGDTDLVVVFQPAGEPSRNNHYEVGQRRAYLVRPASEFQWYVDLLRNEKPVYAVIYDDQPVFMFLHTGAEPVGEGELSP